MRILFLSRWYPFPPDNGAKIRTINVVRQLAREHEVSLISFADPDVIAATAATDAHQVDPTEQICRRVRRVPHREFRPSSGRALAGLLSSQPRYLVDVYSEELDAAVDTHLAAHGTDLIVAATLEMVPYALRRRAWPIMLEELELAAYKDQIRHAGIRQAGLLQAGNLVESVRHRLMWAKLGHYLRTALPAFAACTVVSERERQLVAEVAPAYGRVHVVPNAVDLASFRDDYGAPEPGSIVFAGSLTFGPNYEGARWLLSNVLPRIPVETTQARLRITGSLAGVDLAGLPRVPNCQLLGHVSDVQAVVARSAVSVVPLLSGGGTRLKIVESMGLGTPVVSTSKGAEGLDVTHGENILIADDPADFARCVTSVLDDARLRARLAEAGRALVRARYDWDIVGNDLRLLVQQAAERSDRIPAGART